jgi:hypothetical protein
MVRHLEVGDRCQVHEFLSGGRQRDASVTGTIAIGGETIVSGSALFGGLFESKALTVQINC